VPGFSAKLPVSLNRLNHFIDDDSDTNNCRAAARRDIPPSINAITRLRKSKEWPRDMLRPQIKCEAQNRPIRPERESQTYQKSESGHAGSALTLNPVPIASCAILVTKIQNGIFGSQERSGGFVAFGRLTVDLMRVVKA